MTRRHYHNHCWFIVNSKLGNKLKGNMNRNMQVFIWKCHLQNVSHLVQEPINWSYKNWWYNHKNLTKRKLMVTSPNGNIFCVTGLWGETTGHRWIPLTNASDTELCCFRYLHLSKQSRRWWFGTPSRSLWRHCNVCAYFMGYTVRYYHKRQT